MSGFHNNALIGAGSSGYQIERSLRFNSADSAYLSRTLGTPTNANIWTYSFWVKRSALGLVGLLGVVAGSGDTNNVAIRFVSEQLSIVGGTTVWRITTQVFRDVSAWYHILISVDTTLSTANNRIRIYANGTEITAFATLNNPTQNTPIAVNTASAPMQIGAYNTGSFFNGYLTEINFIDGQALTPSSFGETNPVTGVWGPKRYAGTYGTNGFYLKFADNSNTTAATLGKDSSGNGNNWTPNNFSVTAGAGNDSMIDVPTPYADGGNGRGNYCTLNPTNRNNDGTAPTMVNGNLETTSVVNPTHIWGTMAVPSSTSSWYWEGVCTSMDTARTYIGIIDSDTTGSSPGASYAFIDKAILSRNGNYFNLASGTGGSNSGSYTSYAQNDVVMVAYSNGKIWFGKNGTWMNSGNPAAGTGAVDTGVSTSKTWLPYFGYNSNWTANFGQRAFAYTPPTGFLALNTQNLPEPSIKKPSSYFDTKLYTGNGGTQAISGLGFSPDLVWIKGRSVSYNHQLQDTVRGAGKELQSDLTGAETSYGLVSAFNSDGFTVFTNGTYLASNSNGTTYVAWCWDESATPGFDIVTYTGNGTARSISHNLGVTPSMIIIKCRSTARFWFVNTTGITATQNLYLQGTDSVQSDGIFTGKSSTTFSIGSGIGGNANGDNYVAYLWSEVAGFSKFGSYTGNGSADGPFVHCGFRPRWILFKNSNVSGQYWDIYDTTRDTYNAAGLRLFPNASDTESDARPEYDILSNGFKVRDSTTSANGSGNTIIFAAFAESPFKYSLAR